MRVLSSSLLAEKSFWAGKNNCQLPQYDRETTPVTAVCFSLGRMGYGHFADILQDILDQGGKAGLVCGVETFSQPGYNAAVANDFMTTHVIYGDKKGEATLKMQGAIKTAVFLDANEKSMGWQRLLDYARDPRVQYATINAPESVYGMRYFGGDYAEPTNQRVMDDMKNGTLTSDPAKWTRFLLERFNNGLKFALVSCTNFSKNGYFTGAVVRTMAKAWEENGFAPKGFEAYIADRNQVGFPNTMVDRIAVAPDAAVFADLEKAGILSSVVVTEKNRYWAIEDVFPGGRPEFDKADGVFMCKDFADVKKYEDMKLRILNMSHTTIAGMGAIRGYRGAYSIYHAVQEKEILDTITAIIKLVEGTIEKPENIRVEDFVADTYTRLNNPNIPDDTMRIGIDCSTKILPRLMETYWEAKEKGFKDDQLVCVLKSVAGVLSYCCGKDFKGETFELSTDNMRDTMIACGQAALAGKSAKEAFMPMLSDKGVMGKDLAAEAPETLEALCEQIELNLAKLR
jgi:fructuronate reductase